MTQFFLAEPHRIGVPELPELSEGHSEILRTVCLYLTSSTYGDSRFMRKIVIGDRKRPLAETRAVIIQKGTRYPARRETVPVVSRGGGYWYIPLVNVNVRSDYRPHGAGLMKNLGGILDGLKVAPIDWPRILERDYRDQKTEKIIEIGTIEELTDGLVRIDLADDCCVAICGDGSSSLVREDGSPLLTWEEYLRIHGAPVPAR